MGSERINSREIKQLNKDIFTAIRKYARNYNTDLTTEKLQRNYNTETTTQVTEVMEKNKSLRTLRHRLRNEKKYVQTKR